MIVFSNAKINLGLNIIAKRSDGYHDIETIMIPIGLCDIIEFVETPGKEGFNISGIIPDCEPEQNMVIKALRLIQEKYPIPDLNIHLHKCIPSGAGLGGGSSNAAFMLKGLNDYFDLGISENQLENFASVLGSDCPMFIRNKPCLAEGKGDILKTISFQGSFYLVLIFPGIAVSTKNAYNNVIFKQNTKTLSDLIKKDISTWKYVIENSFEKTIFYKYPQLNNIKSLLYNDGAVYVSMSGSGPAIYGLFKDKPLLRSELEKMKIWEGRIAN